MPLAGKEETLDPTQEMNRFLAGIEGRAYRIAWFATGNREEALDLVQESMIRLADKYAARGCEEWPALFHTILQSRIRDWFRREKVRTRLRVWLGGGNPDEGDPLEALPGNPGAGPEAQLQEAQALQAIDQAIRRLPMRQQQAFLLRAWEGLSTAQTAAAMKISQGSVKTHYSRAILTLRQQLGDHRHA